MHLNSKTPGSLIVGPWKNGGLEGPSYESSDLDSKIGGWVRLGLQKTWNLFGAWTEHHVCKWWPRLKWWFFQAESILIHGSMCFAVVCSKKCCFKLLDHGSLNLFHHGEILWDGFSIMDDGLFNIGVTGFCWYLLHSLKFTAGLPCLVPNEPQFTPQIMKFGCLAISFWVILGRSLFAPSQMTSVFLA